MKHAEINDKRTYDNILIQTTLIIQVHKLTITAKDMQRTTQKTTQTLLETDMYMYVYVYTIHDIYEYRCVYIYIYIYI